MGKEEAGGQDPVTLFCHQLHSLHVEFYTILVSKGKWPPSTRSRTFPHDWLWGSLFAAQ